MPVPTPQQNENYDAYMSRCVEVLVNEGTEQDQAIAICNNKWQNKEMINNEIKDRQKKIYTNQIILK